MYYMGTDVVTIIVNYNATDIGFDPGYSSVYINNTVKFSGAEVETENAGNWTYSVDGIDYLVLNVTITDTALPRNHTTVLKQEITRDLVGPHMVGFTEVETICGGLIVRGLYAEDLVGVQEYAFSVNYTGTVTEVTITEEDLLSAEWTSNAFNGIAVLDLSDYAGELVNITVIARDYGLNEGVEAIVYEGPVPEGEWSPVVLYKGWNLVSLPLIPDSSATGDVLSLILDQGASGVVFSYGYDQYTDAWITNPTEMPDGYGYWFYMLADDVMIVEGIQSPPAPSLPATYEFTEGWVLAGYKQIAAHKVNEYLGSLEDGSYFGTVYAWNAETPAWYTLSGTQELSSGMGFWIWMHSDQSLITPLEVT